MCCYSYFFSIKVIQLTRVLAASSVSREAVHWSLVLYDATPRTASSATDKQCRRLDLFGSDGVQCAPSDIWVSDPHPSVSPIQYSSMPFQALAYGCGVSLDSTRFSVSVSVLFQLPIYRLPGLWISPFVYAVLFALLLFCLMQLLGRRGA